MAILQQLTIAATPGRQGRHELCYYEGQPVRCVQAFMLRAGRDGPEPTTFIYRQQITAKRCNRLSTIGGESLANEKTIQ